MTVSPQPLRKAPFWSLFPSIMLPMFLAVIDQTIVAAAIPAIAATFGGADRVPWVVVVYLIAATIAAPVYGRLGDINGRRRLLLVALSVFLAGTVVCAAAGSLELLIAGRIVQGLGGGGLMTLSQALIGETIAPRERARYQGYLAAVAMSSNTLGPVLGGIFTQQFGWRSIFIASLPLTITAIVLAFRIRASPGTREKTRFDFLGLILFAAFFVSGLVALRQAQRPDLEFSSTGIAISLTTLALFISLVWWEKRTTTPLLPISLIRQSSIWRSDALAMCHGAALVSLLTFIPLYLRLVHGASATEIGLVLLPMTAGIGVGSMITGTIVSRTGLTAIFPSVALPLASVVLIVLGSVGDELGLVWLAFAGGLIAILMGTVMGVVQVTVQIAAGSANLGAAAATVQLSKSLGSALGTAIVSVVVFRLLFAADPQAAALIGSFLSPESGGIAANPTLRLPAELRAPFAAVFWCTATFTSVGSLIAWSLPTRRI